MTHEARKGKGSRARDARETDAEVKFIISRPFWPELISLSCLGKFWQKEREKKRLKRSGKMCRTWAWHANERGACAQNWLGGAGGAQHKDSSQTARLERFWWMRPNAPTVCSVGVSETERARERAWLLNFTRTEHKSRRTAVHIPPNRCDQKLWALVLVLVKRFRWAS